MERSLPRYSLRRALPSCCVSRLLLTELEAYVLSQSGELPDGCKGRKYELLLQDRFGTEALDSADCLHQQRFPDDTRGARIELTAHTHEAKSDWEQLSIKLSFGATPLDSKADISFTGLKAREYVVGLWAGIGRIIEPHRTMASCIHYPRVFWFLPVIVALGALLGAPHGVTYALMGVMTALLLFVQVGLIGSGDVVPYSGFDTKSYEARLKFLKWVLWALAPSLIAGYYFSWTSK